jgi:hypothetical protein
MISVARGICGCFAKLAVHFALDAFGTLPVGSGSAFRLRLHLARNVVRELPVTISQARGRPLLPVLSRYPF